MILGRCDHCKLAFHHINAAEGIAGCNCLKEGCGCRVKREQEKEATT